MWRYWKQTKKVYFLKYTSIIWLTFSSLRTCLGLQPFTIRDHVLIEHDLKIFWELDWISCVQRCHHDKRCVSYNFGKASDGHVICSLNWSGTRERGSKNKTFLFSPGMIYQQLRHTECNKVDHFLHLIIKQLPSVIFLLKTC